MKSKHVMEINVFGEKYKENIRVINVFGENTKNTQGKSMFFGENTKNTPAVSTTPVWGPRAGMIFVLYLHL